MMTNKIKAINFRKNLRPNCSRYLFKEIILSLYLRGHLAKLAFYVDKVLDRLLITQGAASDLKLLKEAADLPDIKYSIRCSSVA